MTLLADNDLSTVSFWKLYLNWKSNYFNSKTLYVSYWIEKPCGSKRHWSLLQVLLQLLFQSPPPVTRVLLHSRCLMEKDTRRTLPRLQRLARNAQASVRKWLDGSSKPNNGFESPFNALENRLLRTPPRKLNSAADVRYRSKTEKFSHIWSMVSLARRTGQRFSLWGPNSWPIALKKWRDLKTSRSVVEGLERTTLRLNQSKKERGIQ